MSLKATWLKALDAVSGARKKKASPDWGRLELATRHEVLVNVAMVRRRDLG